jgi:hypothetical protein
MWCLETFHKVLVIQAQELEFSRSKCELLALAVCIISNLMESVSVVPAKSLHSEKSSL